MLRKLSTVLAIGLLLGIVPTGAAMATTDCTFTEVDDTMTLDADCTTDSTITIPDGKTLDGNGHMITAVDPAGDHFRGAVVASDGSTAWVQDLTVTVSGLMDACDGGADRLRGILFEGASGAISGSTVTGINQGNSGCQEGNAIEVRNEPFDGTHPATKTVVISGNTVDDYQKTGILANGDVAVTITGNSVSGFGPVGFIAQNGVQLGFGAMGSVQDNTISDNEYTGPDWSAGLLLFDVNANSVKHAKNTYRLNERNVLLLASQSL